MSKRNPFSYLKDRRRADDKRQETIERLAEDITEEISKSIVLPLKVPSNYREITEAVIRVLDKALP